jgi:hypothetical protein
MANHELTFSQLEEIRNDLDNHDYNSIVNLIKQSLVKIPFSTAKLKPGLLIDRVRLNIPPKETLYKTEESVSYIKDQNVIDNFLTEYGRANKPHEVIFYGAIESSEIPTQRVTAVYEKSELLKSKESICLEGELYTLSRWEVIKEMEVVEVVFSDLAISSNLDTKRAFEYHFNKICSDPNREFFLRQLKFFSDEYARKIKSNNDYKISVAYTDFALNHAGYSGIIYPSVPSDYKGQNVALKPSIVDENLKLKNVSTIRLHKNKEKAFLNNHKYVTDFGDDNSNFIWKDTDKEYVLTYEQVIEKIK